MKNNQSYDLIGITFSLICGIHCLVTPVIILNFPSLGGGIESPWLQFCLLTIIAGVFYRSVYKSYKNHQSKATLGLGLSGFVILIITYLIEVFSDHGEHHHGHAGHDEHLSIAMAIIGSLLMVSSHVLNLRKCKCSESVK